jgi:hypothetical protein
MSRKPKRSIKSRRPPKRHPSKIPVSYLLEHGTLQEMRNNKKIIGGLLQYHWYLHQDLAYQRREIEDKLIRVLNEESVSNFKFHNWQRSVRFKYSYHPLSTLGSLQLPGSRFNIGDLNPQHFAPFPGLYIASDKETALQETLSPKPIDDKKKLTPLELALTDPKSVTIVSVSGLLERIFDVRNKKSLMKFADLIKDFKIAKSVIDIADIHNIERPKVIKSSEELYKSLMDDNWRLFPMQYDVPANSQIFGQLVHSAGIDGILYKSVATNKDCLVIYPRNFQISSSYIQIDDELPNKEIPKRIDASNWRLSET